MFSIHNIFNNNRQLTDQRTDIPHLTVPHLDHLDPAVAICFFDDDESLIPIDVDDEAMDELYAVAASLLEEEDLFLQRTATTLTLQGDLEVDEDFEAMNEQFEDEAEEDDDTEFVEVLAEFEHKDQDYSVVRIANPFLLIAKQKEGTATDEYTLLGEP